MKFCEIPEKFLETLMSVKVQLAGLATFLLWEGKIDEYVWCGLIMSLTGMREYANIVFAKMGNAAPTVVNNSVGGSNDPKL